MHGSNFRACLKLLRGNINYAKFSSKPKTAANTQPLNKGGNLFMLRRPIDLTLTAYPSTPDSLTHTTFPPLFSDFEIIGAERSKWMLQSICRADPYHLDREDGEILMDLTIGHSSANTHVDLFLHDWSTLFEDIPRGQLWARRDSSQLPTTAMAGPAAVIDLSDLSEMGMPDIDLPKFRERAKHIRPNDILIVRMDQTRKYPPARRIELVQQGILENNLPKITTEVAEWLVREIKPPVYISDHTGGHRDWVRLWWKVEQGFYRNGVIMIDDAIDLYRIPNERVFVNCGIVYKIQGTENSPARVSVMPDEDNLNSNNIVNLFAPLQPTAEIPRPPFQRVAPKELKADLMKRCRIHGVHHNMNMLGFGEDTIAWLQFNLFSNHLGTHMKLPLYDEKGRILSDSIRADALNIASSKLCGPAVVIDAPVGACQNVEVHDLEAGLKSAGVAIPKNAIAIVRTGYSDDFYHRADYLNHSPGFSHQAIRWLLAKDIKMILTDVPSIEENAWEGRTFGENHMAFFNRGLTITLSAGNLWMLRKPDPFITCAPLPLEGLNAAPARVVAIEEYK